MRAKTYWAPPSHPRPSLSIMWLRKDMRRKRASWIGARRRTYLGFEDAKMYPEHSPPVPKLHRFAVELHRIVYRGLFASTASGRNWRAS